MSPTIRPAEPRDAAEIARLLTVLGHSTSEPSITARWDEWAAAGNAAFVAEKDGGGLSGVITTHRMLVLHRPLPVGRITALIVDTSVRGSGLGRQLVAAAEALLASEGCGLLEITSNTRLVEAHAFYEHLGYERTSIRLAKTLR